MPLISRLPYVAVSSWNHAHPSSLRYKGALWHPWSQDQSTIRMTHAATRTRLVSLVSSLGTHARTHARTHKSTHAQERTRTSLISSCHVTRAHKIPWDEILACIKVGRWGEACTISPKSDMCTALQLTCERAPVREKHTQPARTHPSQLPNKRPA